MAGEIDLLQDHVRAFVARARIDCDKFFEYQCPRRWAELSETDDPRVRSCGECERLVYLVTSEEELEQRAERRQCAAVILPEEIPATPFQVDRADGGYRGLMGQLRALPVSIRDV